MKIKFIHKCFKRYVYNFIRLPHREQQQQQQNKIKEEEQEEEETKYLLEFIIKLRTYVIHKIECILKIYHIHACECTYIHTHRTLLLALPNTDALLRGSKFNIV